MTRPMRWPALSVVAVLSLLSALSGCGDFATGGVDTPDNLCNVDDDCAVGSCVENVCVGPSANGAQVLVEVVDPRLGETGVANAFLAGPFEIDSETEIGLSAPRTVDVNVRVRFGAPDGGGSVPARITFTQESGYVGGPVERISVVAEPEAGDGGDDDPETLLAPGVVYRVDIEPTLQIVDSRFGDGFEDALRTEPAMSAAAVLPPMRIEQFVVPTDVTIPDNGLDLDFTYGNALNAPCTGEVRTGCALLVRGEETLDSGQATPRPQLSVRAVERDTGRIVSSAGITDEEGLTKIRIAADAGPWELRVSDAAEVVSTPTLTFPVDDFEGEVFTVRVPRLSGIRYSFRVIDTDDDPVANVSAELVSMNVSDAYDLPTGSLAARGITETTSDGDDFGRFEAWLLPGEYELTLLPPPGSPLAIQRHQLTLSPDSPPVLDSQTFILRERELLLGEVVSPEGEPFPFADVSVIPDRSLPALVGFPAEAAFARTETETSDVDGTFSIFIDPGQFDLIVRPPRDTGFPWTLVRGLERVEEMESLGALEVARPALLRGSVMDADDAALEGATIRAYALVGPNAPRLRLVGEATADADGRFSLPLAANLGGLTERFDARVAGLVRQ